MPFYYSILAEAQIRIAASSDTLQAKPGSIILLKAFIYNAGATDVYLQPSLLPNSFQLTGSLPSKVLIKGADSSLFLLNLYVPKSILGNPLHKVVLKFTDSNGKFNTQYTVLVKIASQRMVSLHVFQSDIYMYNGSDLLDVPVRCSNTGNTDEIVYIRLSDPLAVLKKPITISFKSAAFTDTLLHIKQQLPLALRRLASSQLVLSGAYADQMNFSTIAINVYNISTTRTYTNNEFAGTLSRDNSLGLYSRFMGTFNHYFELLTNMSLNSSAGKWNFHADVMYYPHSIDGKNKFLIVNTSLAYQAKRWGIEGGNISRNFEIPVIGRGLVVNIEPGTNAQLELGYVNGNYNLVGKVRNGLYQTPDALFLSFNKSFLSGLKIQSQLIRLWNPQYGVHVTLGGGVVAIRSRNGKHNLSLGGFSSYADQVQAFMGSITRWGGASTLIYNGSDGRWQFMSTNYLSTHSYAGSQKGALNLEEKLVYNAGLSWNMWARYVSTQSHSNYLVYSLQASGSRYETETAEAGANIRVGPRMSLSLRPYYYREFNQYNFFYAPEGVSMRAARFATGLSWTAKHAQYLYVTLDGGYLLQAGLPIYKHSLSWRVNLNYNYLHFSLNTVLQKGPYFLSDILLFPLTGKKFEQYIIGPGYSAFLLHKTLSLSIYNMITYESTYSRWSNNLTAQASLRLPAAFNLDVNVNRQQYGFSQRINSVDIGLVKRFFSGRGGKKMGKLDLFFYEDVNGNAQYDAGEPLAESVLVKINNEYFTSSKTGKIVYKELPNGTYKIQIYQRTGLYANDQEVVVNGNTKLAVPLRKMGMVKGYVKLIEQQYSYRTDRNISGIEIVATDAQGRQTRAVTDDTGSFALYVSAGPYQLSITKQSMAVNYETPMPKSIVVSENKPVDISFEIVVKKRQVSIKHFISN